MELVLREFCREDLPAMTAIWNEVVASGIAFPGDRELTQEQALELFQSQSSTVCALLGDQVLGVYILHPNNIGRCGHVANASFAVKDDCRGEGIGRRMVLHCIGNAKEHGYRGLQFNAVMAANAPAIKLYESLGFQKIGRIKEGYRLKDGSFEDTIIYYYYFGD